MSKFTLLIPNGIQYEYNKLFVFKKYQSTKENMIVFDDKTIVKSINPIDLNDYMFETEDNNVYIVGELVNTTKTLLHDVYHINCRDVSIDLVKSIINEVTYQVAKEIDLSKTWSILIPSTRLECNFSNRKYPVKCSHIANLQSECKEEYCPIRR